MDGNTSTNILPDGWKIDDILRFIMNVLMYGLGAAATIGVVIEDEDDGALGDGVAFSDCVGHLQRAHIRLLRKAHENSRP